MSVTLGRGEYFDPGQEPTAPEREGRRMFFEAVAALAPEVAESLRDDVLPLYGERFDAEAFVQWEGPVELSEECDPLEVSLLAWAGRWNLREPWVLDTALLTLRAWTRRGFDGLFAVPVGIGEALPTWRPEVVGWNPRLMRWQDYKRSVRREFRTRLAQYHADMESAARAAGFEKTPKKRGEINWEQLRKQGASIVDQEPYRHFWMLVEWQVLQRTRPAIADDYCAELDTVISALVTTAGAIGLTLRKGRRGRPRKIQ